MSVRPRCSPAFGRLQSMDDKLSHGLPPVVFVCVCVFLGVGALGGGGGAR